MNLDYPKLGKPLCETLGLAILLQALPSVWGNQCLNIGVDDTLNQRRAAPSPLVCQIVNQGTYRRDCTPYSCEASRERRRGALFLFLPGRSCVRERHLLLLLAGTTRKEQKQRTQSSLPTRFTRIRRAIVSVGTPVC